MNYTNIIIIATVGRFFIIFLRKHIELLYDKNCKITLLANFDENDPVISINLEKFKKECEQKGINCINIPFSRSVLNKNNLKSYKKLKELFKKNHYDLVYVHTPIASILTRLVAKKYRKTGTKVIYMAHGFHFYKGAPKKNWLLYYPIEKKCARYTDLLITINQEDYLLAKKKFHAKCVKYLPGIGIDLNKFSCNMTNEEKLELRKSIGISKDDFVLLSVGELNKNKNHEVVIKAIAEINEPNIHYVIAGQGMLLNYLINLSKRLGVEKQVHLLGYRNDVSCLDQIADVYILPSIREGLNVSLMEAMATGKPCIASNIRGNTNLIDDEKGGYLISPTNLSEIKDKIIKIKKQELKCFSEYNINKIKQFDVNEINIKLNEIFDDSLK